jgi:hypothetical protein
MAYNFPSSISEECQASDSQPHGMILQICCVARSKQRRSAGALHYHVHTIFVPTECNFRAWLYLPRSLESLELYRIFSQVGNLSNLELQPQRRSVTLTTGLCSLLEAQQNYNKSLSRTVLQSAVLAGPMPLIFIMS